MIFKNYLMFFFLSFILKSEGKICPLQNADRVWTEPILKFVKTAQVISGTLIFVKYPKNFAVTDENIGIICRKMNGTVPMVIGDFAAVYVGSIIGKDRVYKQFPFHRANYQNIILDEWIHKNKKRDLRREIMNDVVNKNNVVLSPVTEFFYYHNFYMINSNMFMVKIVNFTNYQYSRVCAYNQNFEIVDHRKIAEDPKSIIEEMKSFRGKPLKLRVRAFSKDVTKLFKRYLNFTVEPVDFPFEVMLFHHSNLKWYEYSVTPSVTKCYHYDSYVFYTKIPLKKYNALRHLSESFDYKVLLLTFTSSLLVTVILYNASTDFSAFYLYINFVILNLLRNGGTEFKFKSFSATSLVVLWLFTCFFVCIIIETKFTARAIVTEEETIADSLRDLIKMEYDVFSAQCGQALGMSITNEDIREIEIHEFKNCLGSESANTGPCIAKIMHSGKRACILLENGLGAQVPKLLLEHYTDTHGELRVRKHRIDSTTISLGVHTRISDFYKLFDKYVGRMLNGDFYEQNRKFEIDIYRMTVIRRKYSILRELSDYNEEPEGFTLRSLQGIFYCYLFLLVVGFTVLLVEIFTHQS